MHPVELGLATRPWRREATKQSSNPYALACFAERSARELALARARGIRRQNIRLSFISTQRPFLICWTCVAVLARWLVFENLVGGELKISWKVSPDSSASSIFWPVRSLPALFA